MDYIVTAQTDDPSIEPKKRVKCYSGSAEGGRRETLAYVHEHLRRFVPSGYYVTRIRVQESK